jgi:hypothetical protein
LPSTLAIAASEATVRLLVARAIDHPGESAACVGGVIAVARGGTRATALALACIACGAARSTARGEARPAAASSPAPVAAALAPHAQLIAEALRELIDEHTAEENRGYVGNFFFSFFFFFFSVC